MEVEIKGDPGKAKEVGRRGHTIQNAQKSVKKDTASGTPFAHYCVAEGAFASAFATTLLYHPWGRDRVNR